jgi:hypothetical protein
VSKVNKENMIIFWLFSFSERTESGIIWCGKNMSYFRDNLLVPSSRVLRDFPKMSLNNYQSVLRNIPEKCRLQVILSCVDHHHVILFIYLFMVY